MNKKDIHNYIDYFTDESGIDGFADEIFFPKSQEEVIEIIKAKYAGGLRVTLQGARTGLCGGAVPSGGSIISFKEMNKVCGMQINAQGELLVDVQPGVVLSEFRRILSNMRFDAEGWTNESLDTYEKAKKQSWFFPPDPSEESATMGGMASCDASGICSFHYGSMRNYIESLDIVMANGESMRIKRGNYFFSNGTVIETAGGVDREISLPDNPAISQSIMGYCAKDSMDLIDLMIGSEGTLGIITGIKLRLQKAPGQRWGVICSFDCEDRAFELGNEIKKSLSVKNAVLTAVEFLDHSALRLMKKEETESTFLQDIFQHKENHAVYLEYHAQNEDDLYLALGYIQKAAKALGLDEERIWVAANNKELTNARQIMHLLQETIHKPAGSHGVLTAELSFVSADSDLLDCLKDIKKELDAEGLEYAVSGHIGSNHLHITCLPKNMVEHEKSMRVCIKWARSIIQMGGSVAAGYGIGKKYTNLFQQIINKEDMKRMKAIKKYFDHNLILNNGTIFNEKELFEYA